MSFDVLSGSAPFGHRKYASVAPPPSSRSKPASPARINWTEVRRGRRGGRASGSSGSSSAKVGPGRGGGGAGGRRGGGGRGGGRSGGGRAGARVAIPRVVGAVGG